MNIAQKIVTVIAVIALLYVLFGIDYKEKTHDCKVVFNDRLVKITVKDKDLADLRLKSDAGILFTDGEYFFDEPPTFQKEKQMTKIVSIDTYKGWVEGDRIVLPCFIIFIYLVCLLFFSSLPIDGNSYELY